MASFDPGWLPLAMGSMPHTEAAAAWNAINASLRAIPFWPQLPRRNSLENMYAQFTERFPGLRYEKGRIHIDRKRDLDSDLERLYLAYLEDDRSYGRIGRDHAEGLGMLLAGEVTLPEEAQAIKGQMTGPISLGLTIVDRNQRPVLYDEVLADAVGKHLRLKAAWQEYELAKHAPQTIVLLEEPYMASFGSAFVSVSREQVISLFEEVFAGLEGLKGVHCCGNTDWSILLSTTADMLSLDAYDYAASFVRYPQEISEFLARGGMIVWGIVPAGIAAESETVESLVDRLLRAIASLVRQGVSEEALMKAGLVSPSCGLGSLTTALSERVLSLTAGVSEEMRRRYVSEPVPEAEAEGEQEEGDGRQ